MPLIVSDFWVLIQLSVQTHRTGWWSWRISTPSSCMKRSWWSAHLVAAWMAQWFNSRLTPMVSIIDWKQDSNISDVMLRIYFSLLRCSCCRDDYNNVFGWHDTDGYHRRHGLFLQPQMVRSWPRASNEVLTWVITSEIYITALTICFPVAGLKYICGQLFQIQLTAASRDGHQNQHRC